MTKRDTIKVTLNIECPLCEGEGCNTCGEGELEEFEVELPAKFELCGTCRGKGSHVNPAVDDHGLSREDFEEDPDFEEAYFEGRYDVPCHECGGLRVVGVVDVDRCNPTEKRYAAAHEAQENRSARWDAEDRHTRRMESGGHDY